MSFESIIGACRPASPVTRNTDPNDAANVALSPQTHALGLPGNVLSEEQDRAAIRLDDPP
jgi:hypothetical protein